MYIYRPPSSFNTCLFLYPVYFVDTIKFLFHHPSAKVKYLSVQFLWTTTTRRYHANEYEHKQRGTSRRHLLKPNIFYDDTLENFFPLFYLYLHDSVMHMPLHFFGIKFLQWKIYILRFDDSTIDYSIRFLLFFSSRYTLYTLWTMLVYKNNSWI